MVIVVPLTAFVVAESVTDPESVNVVGAGAGAGTGVGAGLGAGLGAGVGDGAGDGLGDTGVLSEPHAAIAATNNTPTQKIHNRLFRMRTSCSKNERIPRPESGFGVRAGVH